MNYLCQKFYSFCRSFCRSELYSLYNVDIVKESTNLCLECEWWDTKTLTCEFDCCEELKRSGGGPCDGMCNPPECKYGYDANPKDWNPDY